MTIREEVEVEQAKEEEEEEEKEKEKEETRKRKINDGLNVIKLDQLAEQRLP